jgi:hypothetical protein
MRITTAMRLKSAPNYKISSDKGEWVCPHCLLNTGVLIHQWDGSEAPPELWAPQALEHLQKCQPFLEDPLGARPLSEMDALRGERSVKTELLTRVKKEDVFHVCDERGAFVCPFCRQSIKHLNMHNWSPELQTAIVEHLLNEACPGRYSRWRSELMASDLQAMVLNKQI